jgi:tetratricopeptide (TPR) repeat protein
MNASQGFINCAECQSLLPQYINKTLNLHDEWRVREHLSECETCFNHYVNLLDKDIQKSGRMVYLAHRPVWESPMWNGGKEQALCQEIGSQALRMETDTLASFIAIKYDKPLERAAFLLQLRVAAALREAGKRVRLFTSSVESLLYPQELEELGKPVYLIFLKAPGFCNFLECLQELSNGGIIVIAGWPKDEWGEMTLPVNHFLYSLSLESQQYEGFFAGLREEIKAQQTLMKKEIEASYFYTCLLDACGIPIPLPFLARLIQKSEDETLSLIHQARGLLFQVETYGSSIPLFCTEGEPVARLALEKLFENKVDEGYSAVIEGIDSPSENERYLLLKLFRSFILRGKRRFAQSLIREHKPAITQVWQQGDIQELLLWGKSFHELFLYEESETVFRRGLDLESKNPYLLQARARMLYDWGKYDDAEKLFNQASKDYPQDIYIWQSWGDKERKRGRHRQAEAMLKEALAIDPKNVYALVSYGRLKAEVRKVDEAQQSFDKALAIDPDNVYALNCLGEMAKRMGKYEQAEHLFGKALNIDPGNIPTLHALGQMQKERGHFAQARGLFNEILEKLDEDNIHSRHALGEIESELGRFSGDKKHYKQANEYFQIVLSIDPENVPAYISWAVMEGYKQDYDRAKELLAKAIEKAPGNLYVHTALAEIELKQEKYKEAEENLAAVLQVAGTNVPALNTLAKLQAAKGNCEQARKLFQQALQCEPENIITYNTWAEMEGERGNYDEATQLLDRALKLDPMNAYTHRQYALILEKRGEHQEAEQHLRRAKELGMDIS